LAPAEKQQLVSGMTGYEDAQTKAHRKSIAGRPSSEREEIAKLAPPHNHRTEGTLGDRPPNSLDWKGRY